jgi:hypothetical protein
MFCILIAVYPFLVPCQHLFTESKIIFDILNRTFDLVSPARIYIFFICPLDIGKENGMIGNMRKKTMVHEIVSDTQKNPELRKQLGELRGAMVVAANKTPLPAHFKVTPDLFNPSMRISDTRTDKAVLVPLFAYREVLWTSSLLGQVIM